MVTTSLRALVLVAAGLAAAGSATVIKGTSQPVTIATNPPNAQVFVDDKPVGVSPLTINISHADHVVSASMPGYAPGYARLTTSFSGWALLNGFTGFITIIVDAITGSIATLDQNTVIIQLAPGSGDNMPHPVMPGQPPPVQPGGSAVRH
jgi:hypothetical protein